MEVTIMLKLMMIQIIKAHKKKCKTTLHTLLLTQLHRDHWGWREYEETENNKQTQ